MKDEGDFRIDAKLILLTKEEITSPHPLNPLTDITL